MSDTGLRVLPRCRIVDDKTVAHHACIDNAGMLTPLGHLKPPECTQW